MSAAARNPHTYRPGDMSMVRRYVGSSGHHALIVRAMCELSASISACLISFSASSRPIQSVRRSSPDISLYRCSPSVMSEAMRYCSVGCLARRLASSG